MSVSTAWRCGSVSVNAERRAARGRARRAPTGRRSTRTSPASTSALRCGALAVRRAPPSRGPPRPRRRRARRTARLAARARRQPLGRRARRRRRRTPPWAARAASAPRRRPRRGPARRGARAARGPRGDGARASAAQRQSSPPAATSATQHGVPAVVLAEQRALAALERGAPRVREARGAHALGLLALRQRRAQHLAERRVVVVGDPAAERDHRLVEGRLARDDLLDVLERRLVAAVAACPTTNPVTVRVPNGTTTCVPIAHARGARGADRGT